jgi:hypothetical protein
MSCISVVKPTLTNLNNSSAGPYALFSMISHHHNYESLLDKVKLPTLHLSRLKTIAIETFKCLHNISPKYIQNLAKFKTSVYNCRYDHTLEVPTVRTTRYEQNSFRFEAAWVWTSEDFKKLQRIWEAGWHLGMPKM